MTLNVTEDAKYNINEKDGHVIIRRIMS